MGKVVLVDSSILFFRSIYSWRVKKDTWNSPNRQYLISLIADLKKFNLSKEDIVIIAIDSKLGSWRKDVDKSYKSNRKDIRAKQVDIPWPKFWEEYNKLLSILDKATPFHYINIDKCEADDIISEACRYYKDKEVIILSSDTDMEQLCAYPNVRIFSNISKKFKQITNPYKVLSKKLDKEATDNLLTPVLNEIDFDKRNLIVNLLSLPIEISLKIRTQLDNIENNKSTNIDLIPIKIARERFNDIWKKEKIKETVNKNDLF